MVIFAAFVVGVVYVFGRAFGYQGPGLLGFLGFALIFTGVANLVSYYYSDKMVLALSGAKRIEKKDSPELYRIVENLCIAAGVPVPAIYIIEDTAPNAFATGRNPQHAAIAVTTGILGKLEKLELEGVIAHELSHVRNLDTRLMAIVSILVGTVALLADFFLRMTFWGGRGRSRDEGQGAAIFMIAGLLLAILSPLIATLIQLAVSRRREFLADASGSLLTRYPEGLANALMKISADKEPLEVANKATAHLYIVNPFKDKGRGAVDWFSSLFNTHPPIEDRVKALKQMEGL
ncbi:MAG: M48 family metallopeptidase [Candidatus Woykebacteria bacterium]